MSCYGMVPVAAAHMGFGSFGLLKIASGESDCLRSFFFFSLQQRAKQCPPTHLPKMVFSEIVNFFSFENHFVKPFTALVVTVPMVTCPVEQKDLGNLFLLSSASGGLLQAISFLRAAGPVPYTREVKGGTFQNAARNGWCHIVEVLFS